MPSCLRISTMPRRAASNAMLNDASRAGMQARSKDVVYLLWGPSSDEATQLRSKMNELAARMGCSIAQDSPRSGKACSQVRCAHACFGTSDLACPHGNAIMTRHECSSWRCAAIGLRFDGARSARRRTTKKLGARCTTLFCSVRGAGCW